METAKKMYMEILDNNKVIYTTEDTATIVQNLLYYLYSKAVNKSKNYTIKNNYNYSDFQKVRVIDRTYSLNKREVIFYNIPTSWGALKSFEIMQQLKGVNN